MLHMKFFGIIASNIWGENEANHLLRGWNEANKYTLVYIFE